jgi:hypothetical protein
MREMRDFLRFLKGAVLLLACLAASTTASFGAGCDRRADRVLEYDYETGKLSSSSASCAPGDPIAPNFTMQVKVKNVNLFRRQVNVKIDQKEFTGLLTVPALIKDNLTSAAQPTQNEQQQTQKAATEATAAISGGSSTPSPKMRFTAALQQFNNAVSAVLQAVNLESKLRGIVLLNERPATVKNLSEAEVPVAFTTLRSLLPKSGPVPSTQIGQLYAELQQGAEREFSALETLAALPQIQQDDKLTSLFKSASERFAKLQAGREVQDRRIQAATAIYAAIEDGSFQEMTSKPVAATKDEVQVFIDTPLTPAAKELSAAETAAASTDPMVIIPVYGHLRPTFSTGLFFTDLTNPTFFKNAEGKAEKNEEDDFSTAGVGALVHTPLPFSKSPNFTWAFSFGLAIKDSNPVYFAGPSFIIGRSQRTVISLGWAGAQVNRLTGLKLGDPVTADQPTAAKVFRSGAFVGISYNFGS